MSSTADIIEEFLAGSEPEAASSAVAIENFLAGKPPAAVAIEDFLEGAPAQAIEEPQDYFADIGGVPPFEPIQAPSVQGEARPPGAQQALRQLPGEVSEAVQAGIQETPEVLAYKIATGGEFTPYELNQWQGWVAGVTSFVASPTTYLSMGLGSVASKGAVKLFQRQIAKKIAGRAAGGGVTLGGITAARDPLKQKLVTGEVDLGQTALETGKSALLGAVAAPAGLLPRVGLAAEIGVFGAGGAALEGRMPTLQDFIDASAIIVGIKLANAAGRGLWKAARGKPLTNDETKAIADITPDQRVQIAQEAGTRLPRLAEQVARESPERAAAIAAKTKPSRRDVPELTSAKDRAELARLLKETQDAQRNRLRQEQEEGPQVQAREEGQAQAQEVAQRITQADIDAVVRTTKEIGLQGASTQVQQKRFTRFLAAFEKVLDKVAGVSAEKDATSFEEVARKLEVADDIFAPMARVLRNLPEWITVRDIHTVVSATGRPGYSDAGNSEIGWIFHGKKTAPASLVHELGHHVYDSLPANVRSQFDALIGKYTLAELYTGKHKQIRDVIERYAKKRPLAAQHELFAMAFEIWARPVSRTTDKGTPNFAVPRDAQEMVNQVLGLVDQGKQAPAQAAEVGAVRGRPELANPAVAPEARELVKDVDEARKLAGEPSKRADVIVQQEADARLQQDYAGERAKLLRAGQEGIPTSDTDTIVAKTIINREGVAAVQSGNRQSIEEAMALVDSYRRVGTDIGRAFRQRRDPVQTPAERAGRSLVEGLLTPPKKLQGTLDRARAKGDSAEADRVRKQWADQVEVLRELLKKQGVDLDNLGGMLENPVVASRALRTIQAAKADNWDIAYEYWNNAILSAPTTQAANIIGNIGNMGWHLTGQRFAEALVNTIGRRPTEAQWGEFPHLLAGILPGMRRGAVNFFKAWETEQSVLAESLGKRGRQKVEEPTVAISGAKGRVIRIPWRGLKAFDELLKSISTEVEAGAFAYRNARARGLRGRELQEDITRQLQDLGSEAWSQGLDSAVQLAFQAKPGRVARAVLFGRENVPGARYVVPFVSTPANIFTTGLRKSPLGTLRLAERVIHGARTGEWDAITPRIAEQMIAWGVVLAFWDNEPADPWITGTSAGAGFGGRLTARRTFPEQSIKIRDKWYSYARLEPFSTVLAATIDGIRAFQAADPGATLNVLFGSLVGQVRNKTFMSGIGDLLNALDSTENTEKFARWAGSFAVSWVPNIVRSTGRSAQGTYPYRGVWGDGPVWLKRFGKRIAQRTELGLIPDQPYIDLWGRESPRTKSPIPQTDWIWRLTMPVRIKGDPIAAGDRLIVNWNATHPDDAYHPYPPRKTYVVGGKTYTMDEQQYTDFLRLSGQWAAQDIAGDSALDVDNPTKADLAFLRRVLSRTRQQAKAQLIPQWNKRP